MENTMREVTLVALEAVFEDGLLHLRGVVENRAEEVASDVAFAWHASPGVDLLRNGDARVSGSGDDASVYVIAQSMQPAEVREFDIPLALTGSLLSAQVLFSRIGLGFNGVSRAFDDVVCDLPEAVALQMHADVAGEVSETSLAVATITIKNAGRSASNHGFLRFDLPEDLAIFQDLTRGEFSCEVPALLAGDEFMTKVPFCLRSVHTAGLRKIRAAVVIDDVEAASLEFPVSLWVVPRLGVRVYPATGAWRAGEWREVEVAVTNSGSALASGVELLAAPCGGVIVDAARELYAVAPMLERGQRVLRVSVGDVAPGEVARVAIRAQPPFMRMPENPAVSLVARYGDNEATARVDVDLAYVARFDAARTELVSPASALPAGTIARIPLKIANSGSAPAENVRLELTHHSNLTILGVEDTRSEVRDGVYYAGSIPAGYLHENALLVRIGAVYPGSESFDVRGVLLADNTYGVALAPATIQTTGEVAIALEASSPERGQVSVVIRSIGDAIAKQLQLRCELPGATRILERSTRVDGMLIPDEDGKSVLVGSGLNARDVEPGSSIPVTFQVESECADSLEATLKVIAGGTEAAKAFVTLNPLVLETAPKYSGAGFVLDHHAVTDVAVLPVAKDGDHAVQPALSDPSRLDEAAVLPVTPTSDRVADTQAAVLSPRESNASGVVVAGIDTTQTRDAVSVPTELPSFDNLMLERPALATERPASAEAASQGQGNTPEAHSAVDDTAHDKEREVDEKSAGAERQTVVVTTEAEQPATVSAEVPTLASPQISITPVESQATENASRLSALPLRLAPATLPLTSSWVRGVITTLSPLIRSNARELSMHAMALRFFLPKQFEAAVQVERQAELDEALTALHGGFRRDTVMAAGMAESASFAPSESWLARVETTQLVGAARAFTRSLESVQFACESEFNAPASVLVAHVDYANVAGIERRFNTGDALATTWVFAQMFPTMCSDSPVLSEALERYRKSLEAVLWDVPANEGLRFPVPVELDDLLTNLHDALRGYASAMGVSVAA